VTREISLLNAVTFPHTIKVTYKNVVLLSEYFGVTSYRLSSTDIKLLDGFMQRVRCLLCICEGKYEKCHRQALQHCFANGAPHNQNEEFTVVHSPDKFHLLLYESQTKN
jgi:hypothetical protein